MVDIEGLRAKLAAAGLPWAVRPSMDDDVPCDCIIAHGNGNLTVADLIDDEGDLASLIVSAVNALPALLDELEALRAALDKTEWISVPDGVNSMCPHCWRYKPGGSHGDSDPLVGHSKTCGGAMARGWPRREA
jgi:hypothetical protein